MAPPGGTPPLRYEISGPVQHAGSGENSKYEAHYHLPAHGKGRFPRAYLGATDPRDVKTHIHQTRGSPLKESYDWIIKHPDFRRWRNEEDVRLLWIKGDPGKGKTMLLCGIIDELETQTKLANSDANCLMSYFFCQATVLKRRNAHAVLRGLIYMIVDEQQPSLRGHVEHRFSDTGEPLFDDGEAWAALCTMFSNILRRSDAQNIYIIVDAVDECIEDQDKLLKFVLQEANIPRVKWLISSRNTIEQNTRLEHSQSILSLERQENAVFVSQAISAYIVDRTSKINSLINDASLKEYIQQVLHQKAEGTFLWVALVVQELERVDNVQNIVDDMLTGLSNLYAQMKDQIGRLQGGSGDSVCSDDFQLPTQSKPRPRSMPSRPATEPTESVQQELCPVSVTVLIGDKELFKRKSVFDAMKGFLGKNHPDTIAARASIARLYEETGNIEDALIWYTDIFHARREDLGKDHRHTIAAAESVARLLEKNGNVEDALAWYTDVFHARKEDSGKDHRHTVAAAESVARLLEKNGNVEDALAWHTDVFHARKEDLGKDHQHTIAAAESVARLLEKNGNVKDALDWYTDVFYARREDFNLGKDHQYTIAAAESVARLLEKNGKIEDALDWYTDVFHARQGNLGRDHQQTLAAAESIARLSKRTAKSQKR